MTLGDNRGRGTIGGGALGGTCSNVGRKTTPASIAKNALQL